LVFYPAMDDKWRAVSNRVVTLKDDQKWRQIKEQRQEV